MPRPKSVRETNSELVIEKMKLKGFTDAALAEAADCSAAKVADVRKGIGATPKVLRDIAKALGLGDDWEKLLAEAPADNDCSPATGTSHAPAENSSHVDESDKEEFGHDAVSWVPEVLCPLPPAPFLEGRDELVRELTAWVRDRASPTRVKAIIAAAGTGKTAVVERMLAGLSERNRFGTLVWRFDETPRTDELLRSASKYFLKEDSGDFTTSIENLQRRLGASDIPHLIILDGLEVVQSEGDPGRTRGELEDPLLKRFLRWVAAGIGTRVKVLITSRFPVPDLQDWSGHRFSKVDLPDLDEAAARNLLRLRGVKGDDKALDNLSASVQRHALTLDVLGSYLARFGDGNPLNAPKFELHSVKDDPKGARLTAVLTSYYEKLSPPERDLLTRLSVLPRGVNLEYLRILSKRSKKVAGALRGHDETKLISLLEGLRTLGLISVSDVRGERMYSAHPFLRTFFREQLDDAASRRVCEEARRHFVFDLEARPDIRPTSTEQLDRYEAAIEITRKAGRGSQAFDLYSWAMGGISHLGWVLGEFPRALRIVTGFSANGTLGQVDSELPTEARLRLIKEWGLIALIMGDPKSARQAMDILVDGYGRLGKHVRVSRAWQNITEIELLTGRYSAAERAARLASESAQRSDDQIARKVSFAYEGAVAFRLGKVKLARERFKAAVEQESEGQLYSNLGIWEAELALALGDKHGASTSTLANEKLSLGKNRRWNNVVAKCQALRGLCLLPDQPNEAEVCLLHAREYSARSNDLEASLRANRLALEIAITREDYPTAIREAEAGIAQADSCGFGHWSLDIRLSLASALLDAGHYQEAIDPADWVVRRSTQSDCRYAWGLVKGLEILSEVYNRLGVEQASKDYLARVVEARKLIA